MLWSKVMLLASLASAWTIEKAEVAVSGSGDVGERAPVSSLTTPVELYSGRSLDVAFKLSGANENVSSVPHQAFIRLSVDGSESSQIVDKFITARLRGSNGKAVIPYKQVPSELHNQKLLASLLVSGHESDPVEEKLFEVVVLGDNDDVPSNLRKNGFGRALGPKPEIIHQFPAPPHHVNFVVALVFVGAIDVLFALMLKGWGASVGGFSLPNSTTRLSLVGLVVAIEVAFALYYVCWSIFSLLTVLAVLLPALFVVLSRA